MEKIMYEAPAMELLEVNVEQGFAATDGTEQMEETEGQWA